MDAFVLRGVKNVRVHPRPGVLRSVLTDHEVIAQMIVPGRILPHDVPGVEDRQIALPEFLFDLFFGNDAYCLIIRKPLGAECFEIFPGPCLFRAIPGDIELADIVIHLFRGLFEKSLPFLHQLGDPLVEFPDDGRDDDQHDNYDKNQDSAGLVELRPHFADQEPGVLGHNQIPGQLRNVADDDETLFTAQGRGGRPERQA